MKLIDLLNMIARGEETPDKIKYKGHLYTHNGMSENGNYYCDELSEIIENRIDLNDLATDEVEIVGEKKIPEKLGVIKYAEGPAIALIHNKVDEIIDYLHSKGDE